MAAAAPRLMTGWVKRRARQFMRSFGTPRAKAVRYALDDWKAMRGGATRSCEQLGVCQREAMTRFHSGAKADCTDPGQCVHRTPVPAPTQSMKAFRRFLDQSTGAPR